MKNKKQYTAPRTEVRYLSYTDGIMVSGLPVGGETDEALSKESFWFEEDEDATLIIPLGVDIWDDEVE